MKTKINRLAIILLALVMIFTVSGCGGSIEATDETKTVTDCLQRQVEIPKTPQHVACLYATAAHMMAMLDEGDKIVGCPNGVKSDVLMQMKYPQITETSTPHQEGSINTEELLATDTDLVLLSASLAANEGEMKKLEKMGIPYVVLDYTSIDELREAIIIMGQIFDKEEMAERYLEFFDSTIAMVDERLEDIALEDAPDVYHAVNEATRTDPEDSICNEIMNRAKVNDISVKNGTAASEKSAYVTLEEIYKWDPDEFIVNDYMVRQYIMEDSKWAGLTAVRNKKVHNLPVGATRWCHPGSMEAHMGVLSIAMQFYPERFSDIDIHSYTADYYEKYFGLKLDDATVDKILAGEGMHASKTKM